MEKTELLKLLLAERDYHSAHPAEVSGKFWYTLGATLTTIVAGVLFKEKIGNLSAVLETAHFRIAMIFIGIGYILLIVAEHEHTKAHKQQRQRIEDAIAFLMTPGYTYSFETFWKGFGMADLPVNGKEGNEVMLFAKEPDTRTGFGFHDNKIFVGILFVLAGVIVLIMAMLSTPG